MKKQYGFCRTALLCAWLFSSAAYAEIKSGDCGANGANVTWTLDTGTGVLEISGTGAMRNYNSIYPTWYDYRTSITSVTIDDGVTTIGDYAFDNYRGLTSVTIGDGVTTIGNYALGYCSGLKSVTIGKSVTAIGERAFIRCDSLTSVTIPESVQTIGDEAFYCCWGLTEFKGKFAVDNCCLIVNDTLKAFALKCNVAEYTIPDGVTAIGLSAFYDCTGLTEITIPNSVTAIGDAAFSGSDVKTVKIGDGVTTIGNNVFLYADLTSVTIGKSVQTIGNNAFYGCTGLTEITIPNSVTAIGDAAFSGCMNLEKFDGKFATDDHRCLVINDTLKALAPSGLTQYTIPDGVKVIGGGAFLNYTGLTSVTIPNSVTTIGSRAFYQCKKLTEITIPKNVTSIGYSAFQNCESLKSVTAYNPTPVNIVATDEYPHFAFLLVDCSQCTLYVPAGSIELYKAAEGWKEFGTILPIDESSAITETRQEQADGHITVYNLQGVLVLETDDAADLKTLQNGAYIVNGKKMIISR